MKGGSNIKPDAALQQGNLDGEDMSTNQESTVLPWCCGEVKVAVHWISPIYDQFTKEAPTERPGKK